MISRKEFVGLGLSAALLSTGIAPLAARAQTAGTVAYLSQHCKGDGSNETTTIQGLIDVNQTVVVDSPNGQVYGIGPYQARTGLRTDGLNIPSNRVLRGTSASDPGRFVRAGDWTKGQVLFRNADFTNGNRNITLQDLVIDGRRTTDPTVPAVDSDNDATGMRFKVGTTDEVERLAYITMNNVELHDFPGIGISVLNGKHINYTNVRNINSARGGIRFTAASYDINLNGCQSLDTGDTAFGFWASNVILKDDKETAAGDLRNITLTNCQSRTRLNSQFGAALMLRGARNVQVRGCTFGPSKNDVIQLYEEAFNGKRFIPKDILIERNRLQGGRDNSFQVIADSAARVTVRYNTMSDPVANCVSLVPITHKTPHTLDVRIVSNTLARPGLKHIRIDDDVRGMTISGNKLIYDDAVDPTIKIVDPTKGEKVTRSKVYIKAVVKDNAGGSGMAKSGIKVYVDKRKAAFDYFPNSGNLVCPKKLGNGKHTVKIVARDLAGNVAQKSWAFTVKA